MKLKHLIFTFILLIIPICVKADGGVSLSSYNLSVREGLTTSFTITAHNAAGRVDIASSDSSIASISTASAWLDNSSATITVSGNKAGSTTIVVYLTDVTTFDDEPVKGSYTVKVNVGEIAYNPTQPTNNKSRNNKLKSIFVDGYELQQVDANNYSLVVNTNIEKIKVNAEAEDSKASVTGTGEHSLQIGENTIEIVITSESGVKNTIKVNVIRKDGFNIEDLDELLSNNSNDQIDIKITKDTIIPNELLSKIKDSSRIVNFNCYEDDKLLYTWIINGPALKDTFDFNTSISNISEYVNEILKLTNYADGRYLSVKQDGLLPDGTRLKIYLGDKYQNNTKLNLYYYNIDENNITLISDDLLVTDGYLEINMDKGNEYFFTQSNVPEESTNKDTSKAFTIVLIISIIEFVIIISLVVYLLTKNSKINSYVEDKPQNDNPVEEKKEEPTKIIEEPVFEKEPIHESDLPKIKESSTNTALSKTTGVKPVGISEED